MSLIQPLELLLANLHGEISPEYVFLYIPKDAALAALREVTGQDFGFDAPRWREWLEINGLIPKIARGGDDP
jgi:hypothetical protein